MLHTLVPNFCSACGGAMIDRFVDAEQRVRRVCAQCTHIAYANPRVLVSTIVAAGNRVLLCRRAVPPALGRWTLPGGFVESNEALEEAAVREVLEETGVQLNTHELRLHTVATLPTISEVYIGFVASVPAETSLICGSECMEVSFFDAASVPWAELTYPDIADYLRKFFDEHRNADYAIHFSRLEIDGVDTTAYHVAKVERRRRQRLITPTPR